MQRKESCCFSSDAKLIIGIRSSQCCSTLERFSVIRIPACWTQCKQTRQQFSLYRWLQVRGRKTDPLKDQNPSWKIERTRKNNEKLVVKCTYCSVTEMQKNFYHFQWAFIQVAHLGVVPPGLSQTPTCMHIHSLNCWQISLHHHTSVYWLQRGPFVFPNQNPCTCYKILTLISRKIAVYQ